MRPRAHRPPARTAHAADKRKALQVGVVRTDHFQPHVLSEAIATGGRTEFTYTGTLTGVPNSGAPSILNKAYTITAEVTIPEGGEKA